MRDLGKIVHAQPAGKITPGIVEHGLNPVRFRFQLEEGGELRLAAGAAMVQHKPTSNSARRFRAKILFDQSKRKIDAGGHARRSPYRSISDEDPVLFDPYIGIAGPKLAGTDPMGCGAPPVEKPCLREDKRPVAGCSDPAAMRPRMADELDRLG